jgi:predicted nucleic acid-binding protein
VLHRNIREKAISRSDARKLSAAFSAHLEDGLWKLLPVNEGLLQRTGSLTLAAPADLLLRAGDALHLLTAREMGETEIWTNDRRMLAAAPYFGLVGKSV